MRFILPFIALFMFMLSGIAVNAELSPIKEAELPKVQQNESVKKEGEKQIEKKEESGFFSSIFNGDNDKKDEKKVNSVSSNANKEKQVIIKAKNISVEGATKNSNENTENIVKVNENGGDIYINIEPKINVSCGGANCNKPCDKKKPVAKKPTKKTSKKTKLKKDEPIVKSKIPDHLSVYGDITEDDWISKTKPKDFLYDIECLNKCKTKLNYNVSDQDIANLPLQDERQVVVAPLLPEPDVVKIIEQPTKVEEPIKAEEPEVKEQPVEQEVKEQKPVEPNVIEKQMIYKEQPEDLNVITEIIIDNERINLIDNSNTENVSTITNSKKTQSYNYNNSSRAFAFVDNLD